jgi:hypothetical protein
VAAFPPEIGDGRWEMGDGRWGEPPKGGSTERGEGSGGFAALGKWDSNGDCLTVADDQRPFRLDERKWAGLEALKESLLHQAFTGER